MERSLRKFSLPFFSQLLLGAIFITYQATLVLEQYIQMQVTLCTLIDSRGPAVITQGEGGVGILKARFKRKSLP